MGKALQQMIIVENVVGAGGTIAPARLKNAAPDGYTLLLAHIGMSTAPALYRTLAFRPVEDFEHIGQVVDVPMTLIARQALEPRDLRELFARLVRVDPAGALDQTPFLRFAVTPCIAALRLTRHKIQRQVRADAIPPRTVRLEAAMKMDRIRAVDSPARFETEVVDDMHRLRLWSEAEDEMKHVRDVSHRAPRRAFGRPRARRIGWRFARLR